MKSVIALALFVGLVGCNRDRADQNRPSTSSEHQNPNEQDKSGVGTTTLTGASWVANDAAIDRIVASRCAREVSCNAVGPDKHFVDGNACVREVRAKLYEDLSAGECPAGIDGFELDQCIDAIRTESCTNPIDVVSRLAACRVGELCLKSEMPHR